MEFLESSQQAAKNSGWFGGIWNKLSLKPKNQMILPDDKNPTIVWDAEKKRWVNTDGDVTAEEIFKPPPKMGDFMLPDQQQQQQQQPQQHLPPPQQQQQQQQNLPPQQQQQMAERQQQQPLLASQPQQHMQVPQQQPVAGAVPVVQPAPAKIPTLQSNMFKMQRNRTLKNSYVDVFNPSGAPMSNAAESVLAPALPPVSVPQAGYFNPGEPLMPAGNAATGAYQQQPQQQPAMPQFYNPNQFGAGY